MTKLSSIHFAVLLHPPASSMVNFKIALLVILITFRVVSQKVWKDDVIHSQQKKNLEQGCSERRLYLYQCHFIKSLVYFFFTVNL